MLALDHIAISAETLDQGRTFVETTFGVTLSEGGKHPKFGTHNLLLGLGDVYLEVIAIDPDAQKPERSRWFNLDNFSGEPRVTNWICSTQKPNRVIGKTLPGTGDMVDVTRGDLTWDITVSKAGTLPFNGFAPAIIHWRDAEPPARRLPDVGCRLKRLRIRTPHAITLRSFASPLFSDPRVEIMGAEVASYELTLSTPTGDKTIKS